MRWLEVHIDTNHAGLDTVQAMLSGLDVDGVMIEDEEEFQDFLENNHAYWDYVDEDLERHMAGRSRITFYLEAKEAGFSKLGEVRIALEGLKKERKDLGTLLMTLENVEDADWENNWKQYYKPMEIGERLLVIPQWEEADPGDRTPLYLDPGLTFGTGAHATTRLCLTALEGLVRGGERSALAVDIDDKCRDAARENAGLNGIGPERLDILVGNLLTDEAVAAKIGGGYDVVLANIVADVIIALAPRVRGLLNPGGTFLCSGVIEGRTAEVEAALAASGLEVLERREDGGWYAFTCR